MARSCQKDKGTVNYEILHPSQYSFLKKVENKVNKPKQNTGGGNGNGNGNVNISASSFNQSKEKGANKFYKGKGNII